MSVAKSPSSSMMKHYRGKLPVSISTVVLCVLAFIGFMYTQSFSSLSPSSIFKFKSCFKRDSPEIYGKLADDRDYFGIYEGNNIHVTFEPCFSDSISKMLVVFTHLRQGFTCCPIADDGHDENVSKDPELDDRFDFDPEECNVESGKWVFNSSLMPFYSDTSCPYLDRQVSCIVNGRPESDYLHWDWQPDDCILPRLITVLVKVFKSLISLFGVLIYHVGFCIIIIIKQIQSREGSEETPGKEAHVCGRLTSKRPMAIFGLHG